MTKLSLIAAIAILSHTAIAEELKPWAVEIDLGAVATSGNTETSSVNAKLDAKQHSGKWTNEYIVSSLFKQDEVTHDDDSKSTEKTAEKYLASIKSAYSLTNSTEKTYLFGFVSHTDDKFGAYRTYSTVAVGYGDWLYSTPNLTWFVEAGPGYFSGKKVIQIGNNTEPYIYETQQGAQLRLATELVWKITTTAEFKQTLSTEAASDNTRTTSETSLASSITNSLQMKLAFLVSNDSKVSADKKKTDTQTSATLVYKF